MPESMTLPSGTTTTYGLSAENRMTNAVVRPRHQRPAYREGAGRRGSAGAGWRGEYTWTATGGLPLLLAEHRGSQTSYLVYGPGATPIYQVTKTGEVLYLHQDHQGSTRLVTNANGTTRGTLTYDAHGTITTNTIPWITEQPLLGYTGQHHDPETGYIYLRARHYDPTTAQFTSLDPLVALTHEPYGYTGGNPANRADPSGLSTGGDWLDPGSLVDCVSKADDTDIGERITGVAERALNTVKSVHDTNRCVVEKGSDFLSQEADEIRRALLGQHRRRVDAFNNRVGLKWLQDRVPEAGPLIWAAELARRSLTPAHAGLTYRINEIRRVVESRGEIGFWDGALSLAVP